MNIAWTIELLNEDGDHKKLWDLDVYALGREQAKRIFVISKVFPKEEKFSLTDQIRRSSRAVNAMIAEAWAQQRYPAAFINKIDEALGEAMRPKHGLTTRSIVAIWMRNQYRILDDSWQKVGAMLNRMIQRADYFCRSASQQ